MHLNSRAVFWKLANSNRLSGSSTRLYALRVWTIGRKSPQGKLRLRKGCVFGAAPIKAKRRPTGRPLEESNAGTWAYIMSMPPMPRSGMSACSSFFFAASATPASVVTRRPAIEAASCSADRRRPWPDPDPLPKRKEGPCALLRRRPPDERHGVGGRPRREHRII